MVIDAARKVRLANIGGQLQFRGPDFPCECYWVEVDTYKAIRRDLPFEDRIDEAANRAFEKLRGEVDFLAEGRTAFPDVLGPYEAKGGALPDLMWFVWYVSSD